MTLKTLKPKANNLLTLDDEFLQYCELNQIEDVQKLAKETFKKGFAILKYGKSPNGITMKEYIEETKKMHPEKYPEVGVYVQPLPVKIEYTDKGELIIKEGNKTEKKDLYDE